MKRFPKVLFLFAMLVWLGIPCYSQKSQKGESPLELTGTEVDGFLSATGEIVTCTDWKTQKIEVSKLRKFGILVSSNTSNVLVASYALADQSGSILSVGEVTSLSNEHIISLSDFPKVAYVYVTRNVDGGTCSVSVVENLTAAIQEATNTSRLKGKKVAFIGDSITWGFPVPDQGYVAHLVEISGCIAQNLGVSGTHIAQKDAEDKGAFISRVDQIEDGTDLVVVMGGTNDFGHTHVGTAKTLGSFLDGANGSKYTFYSGLHNFFKALYNRCTLHGIPVAIVLPIHHGNGLDIHEYDVAEDGTLTECVNPVTGKTYREYVNAIREVAEYYSFHVINAYGECGINPCVDRTYSDDGLHLNNAGGLKFAKYLQPHLIEALEEFK